MKLVYMQVLQSDSDVDKPNMPPLDLARLRNNS
ncbi:hypothetical protein J3D43_004932 [Paenibacillus xylanexedens]|nr:hypothetical protein [Paenibacillus xylanexedens]